VKRQSGMTLIELLVAMVIGLGVTLAVSSLLVVGENHKRTTTSTNDADQTGSYAFYSLNRALRGAGSSLVEGNFVNAGLFGCLLTATNAATGTQFLPRTTPFPAPFSTHFLAGATSTLTVAPLLIAAGGSDNANSDAIVLMSGSGTDGGVSRPIYSSGSTSSLPLQTTEGFNTPGGHDLVLLSQNGQPGCLLEEVQPGGVAATTLAIGTTGTYYYTTGSATTLSSLAGATSTYVTPIGNSTANNVQFELFGVGTNDTLYSYDLLRNQQIVQGSGGDVSQAIADNVIQMNAIYGVAMASTPTIFHNWANPADVTDKYDIVHVMASPTTMATIIAVRVAIVVRGEYYDKNYTAPSTITLFNGLVDGNGTSLTKTITLSGTALNYRYRVFEFTVPLRNMLVLAAA